MIVRLKNIAVASSFHGNNLLLHFRVSALVSEFEDLQSSDEAVKAGKNGIPLRRISLR